MRTLKDWKRIKCNGQYIYGIMAYIDDMLWGHLPPFGYKTRFNYGFNGRYMVTNTYDIINKMYNNDKFILGYRHRANVFIVKVDRIYDDVEFGKIVHLGHFQNVVEFNEKSNR